MGKKLGDPGDPLLVSVRSGSPFSMPGMMDTILNLGLNDVSVQGLIAQTGNERFAWDSYRRFIQMFSKVVLDIEGDLFENAINQMKLDRGVKVDTDLSAEDLRELAADLQGHRGRARRSGAVSRSSSEPTARSRSRKTSLNSSTFRSRRSSRAGTTVARSTIAAWSASTATWARRSTCRRWSSATRAIPRPPASASRATRPTGPTSTTATSSPTRRARTSWPASGTPSPSRTSRRCRASRQPVRSSTRSSKRSRRPIATCATSSSPSSRASCGCCRRAWASARLAPRSRSRSTWSTRA